MPTTGYWYNKARQDMATGILDPAADTYNLMLIGSTYTFNPDAVVIDEDREGYDSTTDLATKEIDTSGYVRGYEGAGRLVAGQVFAIDWTLNTTKICIPDKSWTLATGVTVGSVVLFKSGESDDTTSQPIYYFDIDNIVTDDGEETIAFPLIRFVPLAVPSRSWNW